MENEIVENINITDISNLPYKPNISINVSSLSFIGDEDVIITAGNIDIVAGCYVDLSQLTPQQIAAQENLGTIPGEKNADKICNNCGKLFQINREKFDSTSEFDNLCSACQAKACSLFFGLFSDFKGE